MTVEEIMKPNRVVRAKKENSDSIERASGQHKDVVFPDDQIEWLEIQKLPMAATSLGEVVRRIVRFVKMLRDLLKMHPNAMLLVYDPDINDEVLIKLRLDSST